MLEVAKLNSWYGPAHILFDVSLKVVAGEVVALLGRNGAGKSTTMKSIVGLVNRREGKLIFRNEDISNLAPFEIVRKGLGYVPEDRRIFTELTVEENLEVGRQSKREGSAAWSPERIYEIFPNLAEMRKRPAGRMSGGEQQMLTIGRTLMGNPYLVLLDEPSEGIAPKIVEQMAEAIVLLKREGVSVLLSEQNLHFARLISDRCYILEKGVTQFSGTVAELDNRSDLKEAYLAL
ncbi:ABC transporter ATP-binding protein [Agrobacterium rosae]|uniref:ABC transporter ATP-binding protein n=1 Tax=Agrobacterium rosae TaxID=1972867 RepID=A0AAE5S096_9HYPH|nr:ABC transporter ATP-binding protein [Agrobacterium rosae]KAA3512881.1 ABC transporter ATP-binding protein [Agrobacterium rosae]KAA3521631.1 ABC transporter ATP-binding protein [Agrobacterium rosae]MCM2432482.1 ABC transporter ATP-binding protein [Agrobacterium rosae]MDX8328447.1 ABC transporter ATP-binding protein [Agrobacterium rosae]MQB48564.1 ABC transporter ATP-binding protein [Agrobacterium rosae]